MGRKPSFQGGGRGTRDRTTARDGTWPLPTEVADALRKQGEAEKPASGPVEALRRPEPPKASPAPAFPRPPRPARPPDLPLAMQQLWREVLDRHDSLSKLDHYAVLEVSYEAGSAEVHRGFSELVARMHPDKLPAQLELLRPYAVRIIARLNVARMTLSTRRDRENYLRSLGKPIPPPSTPPPSATSTSQVLARVQPVQRPMTRPLQRPQSGPLQRPRSKRLSNPPPSGPGPKGPRR